MKKILLVLVAWMLSLGTVFAAETEASFLPLQFDVTIFLDAELFGGQESAYASLLSGDGLQQVLDAQKQQNEALVNLINLVSLHGTYADERILLEARLKDKTLIDYEIALTEKELLMASNLFPGSLLCAAREEIEKNAPAITADDFMAAMEETVNSLFRDARRILSARIREKESGEYSFEGIQFTEKTVMEMTGEDLFRLLTKAEKRMIPLAEKLYVLFGMEEDLQAMEQAVEDTDKQEMPKEWQGKKVTMITYTTADQAFGYVEAKIAGETVAAAEKMLVSPERIFLDVCYTDGAYETPEALFAARDAGAEDVQMLRAEMAGTETLKLTVETDLTGQYERLWAEISGTAEEDRIYLHYSPKKEGEAMLSLRLHMYGATEPLSPMQTEGKEKIYFLQVMEPKETDENANTEEAYSFYTSPEYLRFQQDMSKGFNALTIQAILAAPAEVQAYMDAETVLSNALMNALMNWENAPLQIPGEEDLSF